VLFADGKYLLGLDQYQVMSAEALVRFWTLAWAAYCFGCISSSPLARSHRPWSNV
jgi:hypothetical protein